MPDDKGLRPGDPRGGPPAHTLTITNREQTVISGVSAVDSFDDQEIVLETALGTLTIRGEDLNIKQLDLESGRFAVDGTVNSLVYTAQVARGGSRRPRGFLERLLR